MVLEKNKILHRFLKKLYFCIFKTETEYERLLHKKQILDLLVSEFALLVGNMLFLCKVLFVAPFISQPHI